MTDLRRVPVEEAIKQLEFWLDAPWPMSAADAAERAIEIGWSLEEDGQVYARTNPLEPHLQVVLGLARDAESVQQFSLFLTGYVDGSDEDEVDQLKDAFGEFVAAGREAWGKASLVKRPTPAVRWDLGPRGGIRIYQSKTVAAVFMTPDQVAMLKSVKDW